MDFVKTVKNIGQKIWDYMKKAKIELIILAGVLVLDLLVKIIIDATMIKDETIVVIPNFFHLTYVHNYAAAFGSFFGLENVLGPEAVRILLLIFTLIAIGVFSYFFYRFRGKNLLARVSLALIIGGALGNYIDRLFLGYVRDFAEIIYFGLDLPLLGTSFAIFNLADAALTGGVVCFLVYFIFYFKDPKKEFAPTKKQLLQQQAEAAAKNTNLASDKKTTDDNKVAMTKDSQPSVMQNPDTAQKGQSEMSDKSLEPKDSAKSASEEAKNEPSSAPQQYAKQEETESDGKDS